MKNLDILIFTGIVILCFITFFISTFKAFESIAKKDEYITEKRGIISRLLAYLQSLVSE
jgi:CHASE3 domain sensor protein